MRLPPAAWLLAALFPVFLLTRAPLWPPLPLSAEAAGFVLSAHDYSPLDNAPAMPDGLWYTLIIRAVRYAVPEPMRALHWAGALLGLFGLWLVYRTGRLLGSRASGMAGAFLLVFQPILWYADVMGGRGPAVTALSALLGLLTFRYVRDRRGLHFDRLSLAAGLCGGLSLEAAALFLPLWGYLALFRPPEDRSRRLSVLLYLLANTLWILPVVYACGGLREWFGLFRLSEPFPTGPARELPLLFVLSFGLPLLTAVLVHFRLGRAVRKGDGRIFLIWILPGLAGALLPGTSPVTSLLFLIPPVLILFSLSVDHLSPEDGKKGSRLGLLALLCAIPGVLAFCFGSAVPGSGPRHPLRFTLPEIRKAEDHGWDFARSVRSQGGPFRDAIFVFTPCAKWKPVIAMALFPEAEIHEVTLPARGGLVHRVYQHGRAYRAYEPEIDGRDRRVFLFGVENALEFDSEGGREAGPAASESDLFVIPKGRCNILNLSGCRVTVQP